MKFQIRDRNFGIAIYEADDGADALAAFAADKAKGDALAFATIAENGVASVTLCGKRYFACPAGTEPPPAV